MVDVVLNGRLEERQEANLDDTRKKKLNRKFK